jgi:hypothetical protein
VHPCVSYGQVKCWQPKYRHSLLCMDFWQLRAGCMAAWCELSVSTGEYTVHKQTAVLQINALCTLCQAGRVDSCKLQ